MDRLLTQALKKAVSSSSVNNTNGAHEQWFANILTNFGFVEKRIAGLTKKQIKKKKVEQLRDIDLSVDDVRSQRKTSSLAMWFVQQPLGDQNTPDFLVSDEGGNLFYIELKSSSNGEKITWNGGWPKDDFIYLLSSGKHKKQTVFMGSTCWKPHVKKALLEHAEKLKDLTDSFNQTLGSSQSYYTRNMYNDNNKYYSREGREEYEQSVVEYVESFAPDPEILISFDWPHVVQPLIVLCRKFKISFKAPVVTGVVIKIPKEDCTEEEAA